ncbi:MAG: DUF4136 domain-containing protein [Dissulfurispiraceae bacterium]
MHVFKAEARLAVIGTVFLAVLIMGGCATSIKYSYDTRTGFSGLKSYKWTPLSAMRWQDSLLETNVRVLADQLLEQKGFSKLPDKSDLLISISYESEYVSSHYDYQLRMLTLDIYKSEPKELIWRGTASGSIHTDAASNDLKQAVQDILSNFPPK